MSSLCCHIMCLYLLWMILISCSEAVKPKQESVKSLECNENLCEDLNYPLSSQVVYFSNEIKKKLGSYKTLVIQNSNLNQLPLNVFKTLPQLENFDVYGCDVVHVSADCFEGATKLKKLQLGSNKIANLQAANFAQAKELEELDLSDNKLQELPSRCFTGLKKLRKLLLQGNRLKVMPGSVLSELQQLRQINLDYNELTQLPAGLCSHQRNLQDFSARGNLLQKVAENAFSTVQLLILSDNPQLQKLHLTGHITELQLDNCGLETLKLDHPKDLQQLLVSNSRLSNLQFLQNASSLLDLDLSGLDKLPALPNPWSAQKLEKLSISYSNLNDWPAKILSQLPQLKYLDILHDDQQREIYVKDVDKFAPYLDDNIGLCVQLQLLMGEDSLLPKHIGLLDDDKIAEYSMQCPIIEEQQGDVLWIDEIIESLS